VAARHRHLTEKAIRQPITPSEHPSDGGDEFFAQSLEAYVHAGGQAAKCNKGFS